MTDRLSAPGLYPGFREADYHADPCPVPSLSASVAHVLLERSPAHARVRHPQLNPNWAPEEVSNDMDFGRAVHRLLLEVSSAGIVPIIADDYRTKDARGQRDAVRADGRIPLLERHYVAAVNLVDAARKQIRDTELSAAFESGRPELTAVWEEAGVWLRSRMDWLTDDCRLVVDLKVTGTSGQPEAVVRQIVNMGYDFQGAFYRRAVKALTGVEPQFINLIVESEPPYAVSMVGLDPAWLIHADVKVQRAIDLWRKCMARNEWPGYPQRICWAELPAWAETQWLERDTGEDA